MISFRSTFITVSGIKNKFSLNRLEWKCFFERNKQNKLEKKYFVGILEITGERSRIDLYQNVTDPEHYRGVEILNMK
jgi:hypothetical protein